MAEAFEENFDSELAAAWQDFLSKPREDKLTFQWFHFSQEVKHGGGGDLDEVVQDESASFVPTDMPEGLLCFFMQYLKYEQKCFISIYKLEAQPSLVLDTDKAGSRH